MRQVQNTGAKYLSALICAVSSIMLLASGNPMAVASAASRGPDLRPVMSNLLARNAPAFDVPIERSEDGIPLGNGDLGTMFWTPTDEGGLAFQLNKVDAWAADDGEGPYYTNTLPSLARLIIRPSRPLQEGMTRYHATLSPRDATANLRVDYAHGSLLARSFVSATRPVLVTEISDTRPGAGEISIALGLWRIPIDESGKSGTQIVLADDHVVLEQTYVTRTHYLQYAVVLGVAGGKIRITQQEPRSAWVFLTPGKNRKAVVLVTAAVSHDPKVDAVALAREQLTAARKAGTSRLLAEHAAWWGRFWNNSGAYVSLHSPDRLADFLEAIWYMCLYQTASTSRGICPPKFNGSIFLGDRDFRAWGGSYWLWNTESMYFPVFAQNAIELAKPYYDLYWSQLPVARLNARQLWNSDGAWYSEGCLSPYQQPVELSPERVKAAQARNLDNPVYNYTSHIHTGGAEIAWIFYKRYAYTQDVTWLRDRAYPLMKDVAAFYMSYCRKEQDGRYHISKTNGHEAYWGIRDGIMDLAAIRWLIPCLIDSSRTLNLDAEMRPEWQEFLDNLAPYPTAETPGAQELYNFAPSTFAAGLLGAVPGRYNAEAVRCTPTWPFEDIGVGISPPEVLERMRRTLTTELFGNPDAWAGYPGWSRVPIMAARLGMPDLLKRLLRRSAICARTYPSMVGLDHELGIVRGEVSQIASTAVNEALLQSHNGLLQLFPAWPDDWDARFCLLAEGNIVVEAEKTHDKCRFLALRPNLDARIILLNPWPGRALTCRVDGKQQRLAGERIPLKLAAGKDYLISSEETAMTRVPKLNSTGGNGLIKEYADQQLKLSRRMGLKADNRLAKPVVASIKFGPFSPTSDEETSAHFLVNIGNDLFGENFVHPELKLFSPAHGGSIALGSFTSANASTDPEYLKKLPVAPEGGVEELPLMNCAYVMEKGKDETAYLADFTMEADFIPERTRLFGFFFRQSQLRTTGAYHATVERDINGKTYIRFGLNQRDPNPGLTWLRRVPVDINVRDDEVYHLRLTIRNVLGLPMRYADATLEVFLPNDGNRLAATGAMRLNLSVDNMPDAGQAGPFVWHAYPSDHAGESWMVYVRNFAISQSEWTAAARAEYLRREK